ncbi:MAG: glycosyltransferase family protein [Planctomycetota bacterium]|jgi:hypothetical protein
MGVGSEPESCVVLYQRFAPVSRAFNLIDDGMVSGLVSLGCTVIDWLDTEDEPCLAEMLDEHGVTHFVGCLQTPRRAACRWMLDGSLERLVAHKQGGLRVGLRSDPSNIREVFRGTSLDASCHREGNVSSYYGAPDRPTDEERRVIDANVIDVLRSPLASGVYDIAYRGYLEARLSVLEEPFGADPRRDAPVECEAHAGVVYVGGCWSFKWQSMRAYVDGLREAFGDEFRIYGEGWPEGYSSGYLDDASYRERVCGASVVISLHEPSQVMGFAFAPNERVHKLLSMGCCVVSDPNPILETYYKDGEDLVIARSAEDMVSQVRALLHDPRRASRLASSGRNRTARCHSYRHRASRLLETLESELEPGSVITYRGETRVGCCP